VNSVRHAALLVLATLCCSAGIAGAQPGPQQRRGRAIEAFVETTGPEALRAFADEHLAESYRRSLAAADLTALLERIRGACAGFGGVTAAPAEGGAIRLTFMKPEGGASVVFRVGDAPPHPIVALALETGSAPPAGVQVAPITWDDLEQRLDEEAANGFSGVVLVSRGGKIVLHRGYGLANREQRIPNSTETIFAIGSVPIDFTRAAILKLIEGGRIARTDPITKFLSDVPADKRTMTIGHLMSGASGLPDFHHVDADADRDLAWIDRPTAIRRILGQPLEFAPGAGDAHSHSAWVLLAAIVEIVTKQGYAEFLQREFFGPAGMTRTGTHEAGARFPDDAFAVGYESQQVGTPNIPKHWGRTSWLVMGSGGMQSTPLDLHLWFQAIRAGKTLGQEAGADYRRPTAMVGGDDRGFLCMIGWEGDDLVILSSNAHRGPRDHPAAVGRRLMELVRD
jgi:CubicO group peptidase (beta-lactamase class C family)